MARYGAADKAGQVVSKANQVVPFGIVFGITNLVMEMEFVGIPKLDKILI